MTIKVNKTIIAAGTLAIAVSQATADINIDATTQGTVNSELGRAFLGYWNSNTSIQTWAFGSSFVSQTDRFEVARNYHSFDLSGLSGTVTSASITSWHSNASADSASFNSEDFSETVEFYDVGYTSTEIQTAVEEDYQAIWDDIGSGTSYGSLTASDATNGTYQTITLSTNALADIQSAINSNSEWVIGGALSTWAPLRSDLTESNATAYGSLNERVFRAPAEEMRITELTLIGVVPEPSTAALLMGAMALGFTAQRRRRQ